jgi:hypothetical protein
MPNVIRKERAQWLVDNDILEVNQIGFEIDTKNFKKGDGVTAYNDMPPNNLPFASEEESGIYKKSDFVTTQADLVAMPIALGGMI